MSKLEAILNKEKYNYTIDEKGKTIMMPETLRVIEEEILKHYIPISEVEEIVNEDRFTIFKDISCNAHITGKEFHDNYIADGKEYKTNTNELSLLRGESMIPMTESQRIMGSEEFTRSANDIEKILKEWFRYDPRLAEELTTLIQKEIKEAYQWGVREFADWLGEDLIIEKSHEYLSQTKGGKE